MSTKCEYPKCRNRMESIIHRGGKLVQLCDLHLDHILSENRQKTAMTEKLLKVPPIETGARLPSMEESDIFCCAPDCPRPAGLFYGDKPVCHDHAKEHEYLAFDGVYRRRKVVMVERPKPGEGAVVMRGSGVGNEKREKKRKIYPVNPTRGIPLPPKEEEESQLVLDGPPAGSTELRIPCKEFAEAVESAPDEDITAILARINSGELEMPED